MFPEPQVYTPADLQIGLSAEFEQDVTEDDVLDFARVSGDFNPLHVDADYAKMSAFGSPIAHGAYQVGLASALVGMYLPGKHVLLGSVNARFPAPLYFPGRVKVRGEITAWNREQRVGQLRVMVLQKSTGMPTAEILMGFTFHDTRAAPAPVAPAAAGAAQRPAVVVTGASGGIGGAVVADLARDYVVVGIVNRQRLGAAVRDLDHVHEVKADLSAPGWEEPVAAALAGRPLYGAVHAAWPGAPHGGLLQVPDDVIERQFVFGTTCTIRLARLLAARAGADGGRLIVLGSTAGSHHPLVSRGAYSLGKAALEHTVKLLAPELARKSITVNAVAPSFVAAGMNKQSTERRMKLETAQVPLGRLCTPQDVAGAVRYLLSPSAAFVSGQFLGLTGGQL
jgi:NAD(P)-dependent dehydrogenase (short-subunit alcohol dehydrogenase family)/acyl dehydratase